MALDETRWRWQVLHYAVDVLAADAESQLASIGDGHPDELGLDFGDGYLIVPALIAEGVVFSDPALAILSRIDRAISDMSGHRNAALWTPEGVRTREEWATVRTMARQALSLLPASP